MRNAAATAEGFHDAVLWASALCIVAFGLSLLIRSRPAPADGLEPAPAMH
jgi:hypothetical protein